MARTGKYYPYDATLNPTGYKAGAIEEKQAKQYWSDPAHIKDPNSPFTGLKVSTSSGGNNNSNNGNKNTTTPSTMVDDFGNEIADGDIIVKNVKTTLSNEFGKAYKDVAYLAKIRTELIASGQLDPKNTSKKATLKAYQDVLVGASNSTAKDVQKHLTDLKSSGFVVSSGSTVSTPSANVTSKEAALANIQDNFKTMFGEAAPPDIINAYRDELKALELSRTSKTTKIKGVDVGTYGVTDLERKNIIDKYINQYAQTKIINAAKGDPAAVASLTKGNFGLTYTTLRGAYADNGIPMNAAGLNFAAMVTDSAVNPDHLKANLNLVNLHAKTLFPALSDKIDSGYTVKQLLSPYLQTRADILEEDPDTIDLAKMADIAKDPKGLMGLYDYQISLRNDPKWRFTKNAQDSMSQVAKGIAETFGLVG
jgi:hypothetical protein